LGLNVAMITPYNVRCGISTYSRDLMDALAKQDVNVYVVRLPRFGAKTPLLIRDIAERVPYDSVDLVHVQNEYGLYQNFDNDFYSMLHAFGKPVVTTMHAIANYKVDPIVDRYSDLVIVHNEYCKSRYGFDSVIIPHGCNIIEPLPMKESKKIMGIDVRIPIVGYVGFISEYKGLEILIEAMRTIKNAALLIGGGWHIGPDTAYINTLKQNSYNVLQHRCKWLGFVPDEQMNTTYSGMDVVVYPSQYATESGALLTALGHGKAVIAQKLLPFKEKERKGALVTFRGIRSLRSKIRTLLKDKDARIKLEEGARKYSLDNSWENVAKMHVKAYKSLL